MGSWKIRVLGNSTSRVAVRNTIAKSSICGRTNSIPPINRWTQGVIHTWNPLLHLATSDVSFEQSHKVSQYKVLRKWGTVAAAFRTSTASKGGASIRSALAVAAKGDALIHGPRLVAQSVDSAQVPEAGGREASCRPLGLTE